MMFEIAHLSLFVIASLALLVVPGPAVLYIVARSVEQGRKAGLVSTLGIGAGALFHIAAAGFGLSALLVSSALAFSIVKYLGAAYLVYLGLRKFLEKGDGFALQTPPERSLGRIFYQGMVVNLLNPKAALFFFAFLPQFVNPDSGHVRAQILFLGFLFAAMAIVSDSLYALLASSLGEWLRGNGSFPRIQRYVSGSIYLGLGLATAFSGAEARRLGK